jgi:hypothetical protein
MSAIRYYVEWVPITTAWKVLRHGWQPWIYWTSVPEKKFLIESWETVFVFCGAYVCSTSLCPWTHKHSLCGLRNTYIYNSYCDNILIGIKVPLLTYGENGRAIAQAVSRRLPTGAARVRARVRWCGICGGESGTGPGFLRVLRFLLPVFIPPIAPQSPPSIISSCYNRPLLVAVDSVSTS